jgi:hypothetical protein
VIYLVDSNVLSEPTKPAPEPRVIRWLRQHEADLVVDPVVLGEIRFGILLLPRSARRRRLEKWFAEGVQRIQCLPWTSAVGMRWAELLAELRSAGQSMPVKDSLIAASALVHDLTIATRNLRDFRQTGARVLDPFS